MRRGRLLAILTVLFALGGLAMLASNALALFSFDESRAASFAGTILLLLGGTSGILTITVFRKNCRTLATLVRSVCADGRLASVEAADTEMVPLVTAINDLVEFADQSMNDAAMKLKELEIELKVATAERRHAQAIIYSISDAVLVTDPFDELVLANEAAARTFDFDLEKGFRKPIDQMVHDQKMIDLIREMRQSKSANGRRIVEHHVAADPSRGTSARTFKVTFSCVSNDLGSGVQEDQQNAGVVAVLHDMTKEKEVAEMKNDFVSNVSHELRTPLASIKAYVEMLIDGEADDEKTKTEFYEVIQSEANRLGRLIDNILNISRIESGLVKINKQALSLAVIAKEAIEVISPQAKGKHIKIKDELSPVFYQTLADKDMLYQAVLNLLSNAVKYTPENGTITIRTSADEDQRKVVMRIIDTGVGIPAKDLPFVFDKFYRAEANNRMAKGTGLGLSLVKHIVETVHHGRMIVESHVGKGSSFGFELDLCE